MPIHIHRAYEKESMPPGRRVLVDRLWPRGIRKSDLVIDEWARHLAPSTGLRKWFAHDPERWTEFRRRYKEELKEQAAELQRLKELAEADDLVLIYSARDLEHNQAVVIREVLEG